MDATLLESCFVLDALESTNDEKDSPKRPLALKKKEVKAKTLPKSFKYQVVTGKLIENNKVLFNNFYNNGTFDDPFYIMLLENSALHKDLMEPNCKYKSCFTNEYFIFDNRETKYYRKKNESCISYECIDRDVTVYLRPEFYTIRTKSRGDDIVICGCKIVAKTVTCS